MTKLGWARQMSTPPREASPSDAVGHMSALDVLRSTAAPSNHTDSRISWQVTPDLRLAAFCLTSRPMFRELCYTGMSTFLPLQKI